MNWAEERFSSTTVGSPLMTVLFVAGDDRDMETVSSGLEDGSDAITVLTSPGIRQGIDVLDDNTVDAVVSGYELADGSGLELLTIVRNEDPDIPFIMYTDAGSEAVAAEAISRGVTDYLRRRSVDDEIAELSRRIRTAVFSARQSEQARDISNWYLTLIERSPGIIAVVDEDAEFVYRSPSTKHELGYTPESMIGQTPFDYIHPDHQDRVRAVFDSVIAGNARISDSYEYRYEVSEGSWRWFESVIVDQTESLVGGYIIYSRDITERKRRQQALDRERELFERVLNASPTGIVAFDDQGTVLRANERARAIFEGPETAIEDRMLDVARHEFRNAAGDPIPDDDLPFHRVLDTGEAVYDFECRIEEADGDSRWLSINTVPLSTPEGEEASAISTISDITELKRNQRALQREQAFTNRALNALDDIFFVVDTSGEIERFNRVAGEVTGYTDAELSSMQPADLVASADREAVASAIAEAMETGRSIVKATVVTKDGERIPYEVRGRRMTDDDGTVLGVAGIGRDITQRTLNEQRLNVAQRVLRHNLRNQLNLIRGWAETTYEKEGEFEGLEVIMETVDRLSELSGKTGDMAKIDQETEEPDATFDVADRLTTIVDELRSRNPATTVEVALDDDLGSLRSTGQLFGVAVRNTVENAIEHNDATDPWVRVEADRTPHQVRVTVADNGPGIPASEQEVLMEGKETPLNHGSGLGLWLVHWCVVTAGGSVTFDERDPTGSVITLAFPVGQ